MTGHLNISKICAGCRISKPIEDFHKRKSASDGLNSYCKPCKKTQDSTYRNRNYDAISRKNAAYYMANKDQCLLRMKKYSKEKSEIIRAYKNEYHKNRLKIDPEYRAIQNVRNRVSKFLISGQKSSKLGCSKQQFKSHIESLFADGMSWSNYGQWEVDHIYPLSVAYKESKESFIKACHYTNLQPLWKMDNLKKGDKV